MPNWYISSRSTLLSTPGFIQPLTMSIEGGLREAVREQVVLRQDNGDLPSEQAGGHLRLAVEAAAAQEEAQEAAEADTEGGNAAGEAAGEEQEETQQAQ